MNRRGVGSGQGAAFCRQKFERVPKFEWSVLSCIEVDFPLGDNKKKLKPIFATKTFVVKRLMRFLVPCS